MGHQSQFRAWGGCCYRGSHWCWKVIVVAVDPSARDLSRPYSGERWVAVSTPTRKRAPPSSWHCTADASDLCWERSLEFGSAGRNDGREDLGRTRRRWASVRLQGS